MSQKFSTLFDPNPFDDGRVLFGIHLGGISLYAGGEIPYIPAGQVNLPPVGGIVSTIESTGTIKGVARAAAGSVRQVAGLKAIGRKVGIGSLGAQIGISVEGFGSVEFGASAGPKIGGKLSLLPSLNVKDAFGQLIASTDLVSNAQAILRYLGESVEANANAEIARVAGDVAVFDSRIKLGSRQHTLRGIADQSVYATVSNGRDVFQDKKTGRVVTSVSALTAEQRSRFNDGRGSQLVNNCLKNGGGQGCYEAKYLSVAGSGKNYGNSALAQCMQYGGGKACYQKYGR